MHSTAWEKWLPFVDYADLAGGGTRLLKGKPFLEAALFARFQLETDAAVALVRLPVVVQGEQQVVRYALRKGGTLYPAVRQVPAKDAQWRGNVRHRHRSWPLTIKSFLSPVVPAGDQMDMSHLPKK
jgi:hypothetical protein